MSEQEMLRDVGYLRTLAEQGRTTPLVGGPFLVLFGGLLAVACLLHWALLTEVFGPRHGLWFAVLWLGFVLAAIAGWFLLRERAHSTPGASSLANKVDRAIWFGVLLAVGGVVVGSIGRAMISGDPLALDGIMAAAFGLYGVALGAAGVISGQTWLQTFSFLSFAASWLLWMFGSQPWAYPFASAATVVVLVVPGLILRRRQTGSAA